MASRARGLLGDVMRHRQSRRSQGDDFARGFAGVTSAAMSLTEMYARTQKIIQQRQWEDEAKPLAATLQERLDNDRVQWDALSQEARELDQAYKRGEFDWKEYMQRGRRLKDRSVWVRSDYVVKVMDSISDFALSAPDNPIVVELGNQLLGKHMEALTRDNKMFSDMNQRMESREKMREEQRLIGERQTREHEFRTSERETGHEQGIERIELQERLRREGREEEEEEKPGDERYEVARDMMLEGWSDESIAKASGLSVEEVKEMRATKKETEGEGGEEEVPVWEEAAREKDRQKAMFESRIAELEGHGEHTPRELNAPSKGSTIAGRVAPLLSPIGAARAIRQRTLPEEVKQEIEEMRRAAEKAGADAKRMRAEGQAARTKDSIVAVREAADMILNPERYGGTPLGQ